MHQQTQKQHDDPTFVLKNLIKVVLFSGGGQIAFTRSLAVRDNTDGRNPDIWARNRRSDDYELLCRNGHRLDIDHWKDCNLAKLRSPAIVTAGR
jgi:hypothetical protein